MIQNLYMGKWLEITKHPLKTGCLEFQVYNLFSAIYRGYILNNSIYNDGCWAHLVVHLHHPLTQNVRNPAAHAPPKRTKSVARCESEFVSGDLLPSAPEERETNAGRPGGVFLHPGWLVFF